MDEQTITTGFTLAWPWLLALAPVPFLLRWLMPEASGSSQQAVRVPWFEAVTSGRAGGSAALSPGASTGATAPSASCGSDVVADGFLGLAQDGLSVVYDFPDPL